MKTVSGVFEPRGKSMRLACKAGHFMQFDLSKLLLLFPHVLFKDFGNAKEKFHGKLRILENSSLLRHNLGAK